MIYGMMTLKHIDEELATINDFNHLNKETRELALLDKNERLKILKYPINLDYPKIIDLSNVLQQIMEQPSKSRMQNLLIYGDSNMGKTSAINYFLKKNPDTTFENDLHEIQASKPVILAQFPASVSEKGLYLAILENFMSPFRPNETSIKLRYQVKGLLRSCQVKILIFDEIHNLLGGTAAQQRSMMNVLKSLGNETLIPIVGVGTKDALMVLHTDPQHASRFDVFHLPEWKLDKNFRVLLKSFEARLPLQKPSDLASREKATLLHSISTGNLGDLNRLLVECTVCAINEESEEVTLDIIKRHSWLKKTNGIRKRNI